jgi:hypothetical protein
VDLGEISAQPYVAGGLRHFWPTPVRGHGPRSAYRLWLSELPRSVRQAQGGAGKQHRSRA